MITVWLMDDIEEKNTRLFVGHVGLLVKMNDAYAFIEKLSFEKPYQVLKFKDRKDLNAYLMGYYENKESNEMKPIIMENSELFSEYAPFYK